MKIFVPIVALLLAISACGESVDMTSTTSAPPVTTTAPTATTTDGSPSTMPPRPDGTDAKMSSHLYSAQQLADAGLGYDEIAAEVSEIQFDENGVLVEVTLDAVTAETTAALSGAGLVISGEYPDLELVTGSIDPGDLSELAALDAVVSISPAFGFTTN